MAEYEATVTANMSGYTNSMQQALALTKEYTAANEGLIGLMGRNGTKAINSFNDAMGVTQKSMKANVSEAANYQAALGKVSANAVAAGKNVAAVQRTTKEVARQLTGDIGSAVEVVSAVQKMGFKEPTGIKAMSKAMVELGAATGESGAQIASSLVTIQQSYGKIATPANVSALGDAVVATSAKFGASATSVADFTKNIAPFAEQIGMSQSAVVGFSTAFAKMGESGYRSSNVFAKVLTDIDAAVRDGLPTLGVYAQTMGKTYEEAKQLAKENPTEFVLQFTEALANQGEQGIRTLEQLGLEGVRSQKAIKALTSSGEARSAVEASMAAYGGGITEKSAAEQLTGLNEQALKLQESLKQVAANSGEPMLDWLGKLGTVTGTAAEGLAKVTGSDAFQSTMGWMATIAAVGGIGLKGLGAAYAVGTGGAMYSQMNAKGRMTRGMDWIGENRGKLVGGGMAGMALGQITGNPTMNQMGMLAMLAGSVLPGGMNMARKSWNFLTQDAVTALNTPMRAKRDAAGKVIRDADGRPIGGWGSDMGRSTQLAQFWDEDTKQYRQRPRETLDRFTLGRGMPIDMTNLQIDTEKRLKDDKGENRLSKEHQAKYKKLSNIVDAKGKNLYLAAELMDFSSMVRGGSDVGDLEKYLDDMELKAAKDAPLQTAKNKGKFMLRQQGRTLGQLGRGGLATAGRGLAGAAGFLANPVGLGVIAAGTTAAAIGWNVMEDRKQEARAKSTDLSMNSQKVSEAFGLVANTFTAIQTAGEGLTDTFEKLKETNEDQIAAMQEGQQDYLKLTQQQYNAIKTGDPVAELRYQNYKVGNWSMGAHRTSPEATAELLATYGTQMDAGTVSAMETDLKNSGKTLDEVNASMEEVSKYLGNTSATLDLVAQNWNVNNEAGGGSGYTDPARDLLKTWGADAAANGMSDRERATQVAAMVARNSAGMTEDELRAFTEETWKNSGMEGTAMPEFMGRVQGYNALSPEEKAAADQKQEDENERIRQEWEAETYGQAQGKRESAMGAWGMGNSDDALTQAMERSARYQAEAETPGRAPLQGPGIPHQASETPEEAKQTEAAAVLADAATDFFSTFEPGNYGTNLLKSMLAAEGTKGFAGGDTGEAIRLVQAQGRQFTPESTQGQYYAAQEEYLQGRQQVEMQAADPFSKMQTRLTNATGALQDVVSEIEAGNTGPQTQEDYAAALGEVVAAKDEATTFMQGFLKSARNLERQLGYAAEDYAKSVAYAEEDYARQRHQAQEQFNIQQERAQRDHLKQMKYMEEDFQKSMGRSQRDYNKQQERMAEDHSRQMLRHYEDMAKGMMDIYSRMQVEQTWSAEGLLANMREQAEAMAEQIENLDALRSAGMSQAAIDMLGLNDPSKAQQLERLVADLSGAGGADLVAGFNEAAANRTDIASQLFGSENDINTRRMEEEYQLGLDRMAEDRKQWLEDAVADYEQARARTEESFQTQMADARESFDLSMQYMADAHATALGRMAEAQETAIERARENFNAMYEGMTSDFETLQAQTTSYLETGTADWPVIITGGAEAAAGSFEATMGTLNQAWAGALTDAITTAYGEDSDMVAVTNSLLTILGLVGTGGGPGPGDVDYTGNATGASFLVSGQGSYNANNPYGKENDRYAAGYHTGMDISAPEGAAIASSRPGVVVKSGNMSGYGKAVQVDIGGGVQLLYGHMSEITARVGQQVQRGTKLGEVGHTGNASGDHLHFEARSVNSLHHPEKYPEYGSDTDPRAYLWRGGVATTPTSATIAELGPEAVIPLNAHGTDILAAALARAYEQMERGESVRHGECGNTYITYTTNEDHSVTVSGPVEVVSQDPERIGRELERMARRRALVNPNRRG